jgi:hypothetical protein
MPISAANLMDLLRERGRMPAREVLSSLGISQPSLSRLTRAAGDRVLQIGRARATRYALAREVRTFGHAWPVYRIDGEGKARLAGTLRALHPEGWWFETLDQDLAGLSPGDVPWFLDELRPSGFLGVAFARRHARTLGLTDDQQAWNADGVLTALLTHGDDLPGDLVVGDDALDRVQRASLETPSAIAEIRRPVEYARRANAVLAGDGAGGWMGGARPKFTARVGDRHVVVKFSPRDDTPASHRWRDLLRCEHLASVVQRAHGMAACETDWIEDGGRAFLEVSRFDRVGPHGRRATISFRAAGATVDADALRVRSWFARLIGMPAAKATLTLDRRLAPAYGLMPSLHRPLATGELPETQLQPPMPPPQQRDAWHAAAVVAEELWRYVAEDGRVTDDFRDEAATAADAIERIRARV